MARKILLADDSVTAQNMGRKILADAGYEVITVNNGSAALKRIAEAKPDVIVLDVYMPGYSGLEVCQRLKESNDTARIPILLTVGKLEPFKPEEARRVRAEGFIVKPFEASELLSALTKLEDKIVPRSDSSKPGRFARAIAAVEEGRYDRTVAIDEDSGWRNRISFPKKKETPVEPEAGDDSAIYNPVNRDLKTFVEHRPPQARQPAPPATEPTAQHAVQPATAQADAQVDLGALVAAHGLPKDVTPEEIAALAAAAAQVQGITESGKSETANAAPAGASQVEQAEWRKAEEGSPSKTEAVAQTERSKSEPVPVQEMAVAHAAQTVETSAVAAFEIKAEEASESEAREVATEKALGSENTSKEMGATFAPEAAIPEQTEPDAPSRARAAEIVDKGIASAAVADALPAVASFAAAEASRSTDNGSSANATSKAAEPEPVTMAVAAAQAVAPSRWSAVAVALAPEEASISLEEEMRQVQAAALAVPSSPSLATDALAMEATTSDEPAKIVEQAAVAERPFERETATATAPPPASEPAPEERSVAATPASFVVKEFETVTPREPEPVPTTSEATAESDSPACPVTTEAAELSTFVSAAGENAAEIKQPETIPAVVPSDAAESSTTVSAIAQDTPDAKQPESIPAADVTGFVTSVVDGLPADNKASESEKEPVQAEAVSEAVANTAEPESLADKKEQEPEPAEISITQAPDTHIPQENVEPAAAAAKDEISGGLSDMAKKESEMAASTAAAWASWRRIRETADNKDASTAEKESETAESPREEAAMAVAAGAEKAPEEPGNSEVSPEIASIVDSVLADLRPKIVEEISRKLGKKK